MAHRADPHDIVVMAPDSLDRTLLALEAPRRRKNLVRGVGGMGDHVDMELRHDARGTFDGADRAGLVEEVGEVGDVHRALVSCFSVFAVGTPRRSLSFARRADGSISDLYSRLATAAAHPGPDDDAIAMARSEPTIDSMPSKTSDNLASVVRQLDAETLASVLIELAADHAAVRERLVRLQLSNQPKALATVFRKRLAAWKRSTKYVDYSQVSAFGRELQAWLEQVEHELILRVPAEALALAEAFIQGDEMFFNRADDSSGVVGDAVRAACLLWLKAASRCDSPASAWPDRIATLFAADQYGAREELLRRSDLLLSTEVLRGLVASCEAQLDDALGNRPAAPTRVNWPASRASTALSLLSEAMRDPDVLVRSMLRHSPSPNPMQKSTLAEAFLKYGRPEGALAWLEGSWAHLDSTRLHLHAQALAALGRTSEAAADRQQIFEASLAVWDLHAWLDLMPPHEQASAIEHARELAAAHADPTVVALLLMDIGDDSEAEMALVRDPGAIQGRDYGTLAPLAEALERKGLWTGATVVYRALLVAILDRAYSPAYHHAARYWARLAALAPNFTGPRHLESPEMFEAGVRTQHKRKSSFWAHVSGARRADDNPSEDSDE